MPWSPAQNRLFYAAANSSKIAKEHGLSREKALELAKEGVRPQKKRNKLAEMAK